VNDEVSIQETPGSVLKDNKILNNLNFDPIYQKKKTQNKVDKVAEKPTKSRFTSTDEAIITKLLKTCSAYMVKKAKPGVSIIQNEFAEFRNKSGIADKRQ
jgi:hypothetical protein